MVNLQDLKNQKAQEYRQAQTVLSEAHLMEIIQEAYEAGMDAIDLKKKTTWTDPSGNLTASEKGFRVSAFNDAVTEFKNKKKLLTT